MFKSGDLDGEAKLDLLCIKDASDHIPETLLQEELGYDRDRAEGTHGLFLLLLEVAWVAGSHHRYSVAKDILVLSTKAVLLFGFALGLIFAICK